MKRQRIVEGLIGILLLIGMATAQGAEYCVNSAGALNTALAQASTNGQDDTIRVVQGTYTGLFYYSSSESRDVTVLGGYTSGCASRTLDPANTTLQGGGSNTVLVLVTTGNGDFTLEGVTVTGGNRSGNGGGLYTTTEGDVTLAKNRFDGNTAAGEGSGAYIDSGRDVTLTENRFSANGDYGSAVFIYAVRSATLTDNAIAENSGHGAYLSAATGAATLTGNSFTDNSRGGLYVHAGTIAALTENSFIDNDAGSYTASGATVESPHVELTNNRFEGNLGYAGGAYVGCSSGALTNNTFSGNTSYGYTGGGLYLAYCTADLVGNSFHDNSAYNAGGAYVHWGVYTLTNNRFDANLATNAGAGVYAQGGDIVLNNNRFTANDALGSAGAVRIESSANVTLTNNSLHANSATDGGALFLDGLVNTATARLYNNVFWDNDADQGADLWIDNDADMDFIPAPVTLKNNDIDQTFGTGYWSTLPLTIDGTNLDAVDPRFADALLHLSAASPLIDAGDSNAPELPATDMDGEARIMGVRVEIGADEYDDGVTRYRLTVQPSGQGEVTSRDGQIDCGSACLANYLPGTQVIMDAVAADGWVFERWDGACAGSGSCTVTMGADRLVTASFIEPQVTYYPLEVQTTGSGAVRSQDGLIDCGSACDAQYADGTQVILEPFADAGWTFDAWDGDCAGSASCVVAMDRARSVSAVFTRDAPEEYRLTVDTAGEGTVISRDGRIDCGGTCEADYAAGATVVLDAVADDAWIFQGWDGACSGTGSCTVRLDADQSVSATFEPCPAGQLVAAEGASSGWIDLAYAVRDEVLPRVAYGDWMVRAYYRHAVEVSGRLLIDRSLRKQALVLFKQLEPSLRKAVAGGEPQVTPAARGAIERFVAALSRGASPALKGDLDAFLSRF